MRVYDMQNNENNFYIQARINEMLDECGNLCQFVAGDVNYDGELNVVDLVILVEFIVGWSEPTEAQLYTGDMNADGVLNVLDAVLLVDVILAE